MPLVELCHVSKTYREPESGNAVPVFHDINLSLERGESVAIVGPSGCGKSTLLNIIGTLDEPNEGEVLIDGKKIDYTNPAELSALRSGTIGFIFQLHHLMPQCTVLENVLLPTLALAEKPNLAEVKERAIDLLKIVGLEARALWRPAQLSGGERQRVAVVRALINQPKLILADEPTGALDEANSNTLTSLMISLVEKFDISLVLVTHQLAQAAQMKKHYRLHQGSLVTE